MFDIGFLELILVSIVGLLVLGPERLPGAIRTVMAYVNKIRRSFAGIRAEIERELHADEFRQDLHNQGIMQELKKAEKALRSELNPDNLKLGKDGYPVDEPYESSQAGKEPSAQGKEPSAQGKEPSAQGKEPSAEGKEPSAESEEPSADFKEPSAESEEPSAEPEKSSADQQPVREHTVTEDTPEDETRAAKP